MSAPAGVMFVTRESPPHMLVDCRRANFATLSLNRQVRRKRSGAWTALLDDGPPTEGKARSDAPKNVLPSHREIAARPLH